MARYRNLSIKTFYSRSIWQEKPTTHDPRSSTTIKKGTNNKDHVSQSVIRRYGISNREGASCGHHAICVMGRTMIAETLQREFFLIASHSCGLVPATCRGGCTIHVCYPSLNASGLPAALECFFPLTKTDQNAQRVLFAFCESPETHRCLHISYYVNIQVVPLKTPSLIADINHDNLLFININN